MAGLVFITGASSGIGQALALRFYQGGYTLALIARRTEHMRQWTRYKSLDPDRFRVYAADVSDIDSAVAASFAGKAFTAIALRVSYRVMA